jgi:hypothetical protein
MVAIEKRNCLSSWLVALAFAAVAGRSPPQASGMDVPKAANEALARNETALNTLTVSWERTRRSHLPLDQLLRLIKWPNEKAFFHPEYVTLTYQDGRLCYNCKQTQWMEDRFRQVTSDIKFDGKALFIGNLRRSRPVVTIFDSDKLKTYEPECYVLYAEYLEAAGFEVHNRNATVHQPPESEVLYLIRQGADISNVRYVTAHSSKCLLVEVTRAEGRDVFVCDSAMQYAVREMKKYGRNGRLTQTTVNSQFVELPSPHIWLPMQCRVSNHNWHTIPETISKEPIIVTDIHVKELSQKAWPASHFMIDHSKPGTIVGDSRKEAAKMPGAFFDKVDGMYKYTVNPTPEDLAYAVAVSRSRSRRAVIAVCVILMVVLSAVLVFRQYRRRQAIG